MASLLVPRRLARAENEKGAQGMMGRDYAYSCSLLEHTANASFEMPAEGARQ